MGGIVTLLYVMLFPIRVKAASTTALPNGRRRGLACSPALEYTFGESPWHSRRHQRR